MRPQTTSSANNKALAQGLVQWSHAIRMQTLMNLCDEQTKVVMAAAMAAAQTEKLAKKPAGGWQWVAVGGGG
jgi:hypothetical protein